jgi:hypothetical protein
MFLHTKNIHRRTGKIKDARSIAQLMQLGWFSPGALQIAAGARDAQTGADQEP